MRSRRFACRKCQRLAYSSQAEDAVGRAWRVQQKCERKLDQNWARPKGMHHTTRQRLLQRIWDCEQARDDALANFLDRQVAGWRKR
jgi:ribosomal protein L32E